MNIFQRYFSKHLEKMRETLSESQIIEYEQKADEMIKLIAWISIASLIILIIGEVDPQTQGLCQNGMFLQC